MFAGVVVGRQFIPADRPGEQYRIRHPEPGGQPLQPGPVRAVADEHEQRRLRVAGPRGEPGQHLRPGPDQGVLALAPHHPGHADHDLPVRVDAEPLADLGAARPGPESGRVHARRQPRHPGRRRRGQRLRQPEPEVLGQVGEDVDPRPDPAQQPSGARQRGPARLVPVRQPDDPARPGRAQAGRQQPERGRRAEQDRVAAVLAQQRDGPVPHRRHRQHERAWMPDDRERQGRVELGRARPGRRVDDHPVRGQPDGERVHERLNPAAARRVVVGDDQDLGQSGSPAGSIPPSGGRPGGHLEDPSVPARPAGRSARAGPPRRCRACSRPGRSRARRLDQVAGPG